MNLTALKTELAKEEYQGLTDAQALAALPQPTEAKGRIDGDNKLDLVTMVLKGGLDDEWQAVIDGDNPTELKVLAKALKKALDPILLMQPNYRINIGDNDVAEMLLAAKTFNLLNETQYAKVESLGTYTKNAEFDGVDESHIAAARYIPQEIQVTYPSESYIIKAGTTGFEFTFDVTDGSVENIFDVRMEVCDVEGGQAEAGNWYEMKGLTPVRQGQSAKFVEQLMHSQTKKTKMYCRFWFTPRKACEFAVSVAGV